MANWLLQAGALCALAAYPSLARAQKATFQMLPNPAGPTWSTFALSHNGAVMAANYGGAIFRWTAAGGFVGIGHGDINSTAIGISYDGAVIIGSRKGTDGNVNPAVWHAGTGWVNLGHPPEGCVMDGSWGSGYSVNGDGTLAVGLAWYCPGAEGFLWNSGAGMIGLSHSDGMSSRASAISADGATIVGFSEQPTQGYRRPVRWVDTKEDFFAGDSTIGEATAVSSNGSKIVGQDGFLAFYYTDEGGIVLLGTLSGKPRDSSVANGVADSGRVVGWSGNQFNGRGRAFFWDPKVGMVGLKGMLNKLGAKVPGNVYLTDALAISADGSTIAGQWQDSNFNTGGFVATLPSK